MAIGSRKTTLPQHEFANKFLLNPWLISCLVLVLGACLAEAAPYIQLQRIWSVEPERIEAAIVTNGDEIVFGDARLAVSLDRATRSARSTASSISSPKSRRTGVSSDSPTVVSR